MTRRPAKQLLPAIDLRSGEVVRLRQGDDRRRTVYGDDPVAVLEGFAAAGARWVHAVDLDAAFGEEPQRPLLAGLARRAAQLGLCLQLGGGLRDRPAVAWALEAGCSRAVVGSMIARDFDLFADLVEEFPQRIVPGLDLKGGRLEIAGWTERTELDGERLGALLRGLDCPALLVTDIRRDGELDGPNLELARSLGGATGIPALVSGGIHTLDDLRRAFAAAEIGGAVVGRALYDGSFTLPEALAFLS